MALEYTQRLEKIEALIRAKLPENPGGPWMTGTFSGLGRLPSPELVQSLTRPGWDLINRGGKRWRPLLSTLVCESLGGGDAALPLLPLVEFPHNASLIHDDIEDNSDQRRGRPAVHLIYGADAAINGGCFLYFLPLACLSTWAAPPERKNRLYEVWGEYMRRLHLGQAMDIAWHRDFSSLPGLEEYDLMCRLKTGCLARLAAVLGVYAADTALYGGNNGGITAEGEALALLLGEGAEKLGVGFQILDDVKNLTTGNPGKKRGDDIVEGKKSLPILLYLHARPEKRDFAARCFAAARSGGIAAPEVEELIAALEAAGILEEAGRRGLALIAEARELLAGSPCPGFPVNRDSRDLLAALADLISG
jgi:octaprenyl-diphosphate synthase